MKRSLIALISSIALTVALPALAAEVVAAVVVAVVAAVVATAQSMARCRIPTSRPAWSPCKASRTGSRWWRAWAPTPSATPSNADAWNELGHAHRQLGAARAGLDCLRQGAASIDPKHKGAHEYLGEAYLQMGDVARAEQELKALDTICFLPCEQYADLKAQIAAFKTQQAKAGS